MAEKLDTPELTKAYIDDSSDSTEESSSPSDSKPPGSGLLSYLPSYSLFYSAPSVRNKDRGSVDKNQKHESSIKRDVSHMTPLSAPVNRQIAPFVPTFINEHKKNGVIGSLKSVLFYPFSGSGTCDKCSGILPPSQRECSCVDTLEFKPPLAPCPQSCDSCCQPEPLPPMYPINKCSVHGSKNTLPPPPTPSIEETQETKRKEKKRFSPWSVLVDQSEYGCGCDSDCNTTPTSKTISFQKFDDCPSSPTQPEIIENLPQKKLQQPSNTPHKECEEAQVSPTSKQLEKSKLKHSCDSSVPKPSESPIKKCQSMEKCPDCGQSNPSPCVCQQICNNSNGDNSKKEIKSSKYTSVVSALYHTKKSSNDCNSRKEPCECTVLPPKMNALSSRGDKESNCQPSSGIIESQPSTECTMLPPKLAALTSPTSQEAKLPTKLPKSSPHVNKEIKCKHSSKPCECILFPPKLTALSTQTSVEHHDCDLQSEKGQPSIDSCDQKGLTLKTTEDNEKASSPLRSLFGGTTKKQKQDETDALFQPKDDCPKEKYRDATCSCVCQEKECEEKSSNKRQTICQKKNDSCEREKKLFSCVCGMRKHSYGKEENKCPWACYKKPANNNETKATCEPQEMKSDCGRQEASSVGCQKPLNAQKGSFECSEKKSAYPCLNVSSNEECRTESQTIASLHSKGEPSSDPVTETPKFSFWCPKKSEKPSLEDCNPYPPSEEKKSPPSQMKCTTKESPKKCECPQCNIVCCCPPYCCCVTQPKCCNISCCCCCSMKQLRKKQILGSTSNEGFQPKAKGESYEKTSKQNCEEKNTKDKNYKNQILEICCPIEFILKDCESEGKDNEDIYEKNKK